MIFVVNHHIVRTVHDLSVHPDHEFFTIVDFYSVGITVVTCSPDVPFVWCDPVCIFVIDDNGSGTAGDEGTIEKFFGFGVYFDEHYLRINIRIQFKFTTTIAIHFNIISKIIFA